MPQPFPLLQKTQELGHPQSRLAGKILNVIAEHAMTHHVDTPGEHD